MLPVLAASGIRTPSRAPASGLTRTQNPDGAGLGLSKTRHLESFRLKWKRVVLKRIVFKLLS